MEKSIKKKLLCLLILVLFFVISEHARLVAAMHVIARNSPMFTTAKNAEIFAGISTKYTPVFSWKCEKIDDFYFSVNAATVGMGRRYVPSCPAPPLFFWGGGRICISPTKENCATSPNIKSPTPHFIHSC